jgi:UDP-N-acetylmuramoyl-tripeptide--D-alanyl-D-alanine ligase
MQAAIEAFDKGQNDQINDPMVHVYILGAMRELGEYSRLEHQNIVNMLLERKADKVLLVGGEYKETTAPYPVYDDVDALCEALRREPLQGCRILLKGSRSNQLEKVLPLL